MKFAIGSLPCQRNFAFGKKSRRGLSGFTLTELMVVILIIVVLASLGFTGYKRLRTNASAVVDANDMRTIYSAITMYSADNNGFLPTSYNGVGPIYTEGKKGLVNSIHPYLGVDDPEDGHYFEELAAENFKKARGEDSGPSLLIMANVYSGKGRPDDVSRPSPSFNPFGYPSGNGKKDPMKLSAALSKMGSPAQRLMMTENDKVHPNYNGSTPGWFNGLAEGMAHGSYRLGVYWDGHVGKLDIDLNAK